MSYDWRDSGNWDSFFSAHADYRLRVQFYGVERDFTLEELYQALKARLEAERIPLQSSGDT